MDINKQVVTLAKIWAEAIEIIGTDAVARYIAMLQDQTKWADVQSAEVNISKETATRLRKFLQGQNPQINKFYFHATDLRQVLRPQLHILYNIGELITFALQASELITNSLRQQPIYLSNACWLSMKSWNLLRTPNERRRHLLFTAPISCLQPTEYS